MQEIWLQIYLLVFLRKTPSKEGGGEEHPKDMLAYLLIVCAVEYGGHFVFS
jgi:hypothetical protein